MSATEAPSLEAVVRELLESDAEPPKPADPMALLRDGDADIRGYEAGRSAACADRTIRGELEQIASDPDVFSAEASSQSDQLFRRGLLLWYLDDHAGAAESLHEAIANPMIRYFEGRVALEQRRWADAAEVFAHDADDQPESALGLAEALVCGADDDRLDEASELLDRVAGDLSDDPRVHVVRGMLADRLGHYVDAAEAYVEALKIDPRNGAALYRLACVYDLRGEDDLSMSIYERCAKLNPPLVNALLNLGLRYEDRGDYEDAIRCYERVLKADPRNRRAQLFLKDARASTDMFFDEERERTRDRENMILSIPVTDFELSVRARNCLARMNIVTLGDLIKKTEQDLLTYRNFGETSLQEIKDMLAQKGLRLGMGLDAGEELQSRDEEEEVLGTPVAHLDLSARARRVMNLLQINTLGELIQKTEAELLACRNFGQSSLTEVQSQLEEYGLSLADSAGA